MLARNLTKIMRMRFRLVRPTIVDFCDTGEQLMFVATVLAVLEWPERLIARSLRLEAVLGRTLRAEQSLF